MVRSVAKKVMWVGRATVFVMGLALMLALVFGMASTALGANGANFIIGNGLADTLKNIATLPTKLTMQGTNSGPALQVTQQSTNTGASGVGVTVPSGKAPIKVNSTAGKATNLNADKLDGIDSAQFQRTVAQSGQLLSGQLAARYIVDDMHFTLASASYPVPLPANTPAPVLQVVMCQSDAFCNPLPTTNACPGIGQATPGTLCIYAYHKSNIESVTFSGSNNANTKLYGFSLDVFPTTETSSGYLLANWAYRVP